MNARHQQGFTLVELIVASTLMALVLSGVYLTFSTAVRAWRSGESNYAPYQDVRRALGTLDRELHSIPMNARHLIKGDATALEFVTLAEPLDVESAQGAQLIQVRYRVVKVDDADCLVREEALVVPPLPAAPAEGDRGLPAQLNTERTHQFVLARDVVSFRLSYLWPAPDIARRPPNVPPPPVQMLSTSRIEYALPQGITIDLTLRDVGNLANNQQRAFHQTFSALIPASPVPESLLRTAGPRPR